MPKTNLSKEGKNYKTSDSVTSKGRPVILDSDTIRKKALKATRRYYHYSTIAAHLGISTDTLKRYRLKHKEFNELVQIERNKYLMDNEDKARTAGENDWRYWKHNNAVAKPEDFSERARIKALEGEEGHAPTINIYIDQRELNEAKEKALERIENIEGNDTQLPLKLLPTKSNSETDH